MPSSIKTQFTLLFALLALAPIAIIFAIYSPSITKDLTSKAIENLQSIGKSQVHLISLWITQEARETALIALSPPVLSLLRPTLAKEEYPSDFLASAMKEHNCNGIYILDKGGNLRAFAGDKDLSLPREALERALKGLPALWASYAKEGGALFVSSPIRIKTAVETNHTPQADSLGAPPPGLVGTAVAKIDLSQIVELLKDIKGLRREGALLVDRAGVVVACLCPEPSPDMIKNIGKKIPDPETGSLTLGVEGCITGKEGHSPHAYTNDVGKKVLGSWGWLKELDLGIIVELEAERVFELSSMVRGRLWSLLLVIGVGVVITAVFISRKLSEPLLAIIASTQKIAQGHLEERVEMESRLDEIGELTRCINTMVDSLQKKNVELQEANVKLAETSIRDGLTGLYNHYFFQEIIDSEYHRAKRYNLPLTLLMIDLDNFKVVNDTCGHPFGDFVLKETAKLIESSTRDTDISCRYGGEEFIILLPNTEIEGAYAVAEKLRQAFANHTFHQDDLSTKLTITVGISTAAEEGIDSKDDLVRHADSALLEGKTRGRNMVISWQELITWEKIIGKEENLSERYYLKFQSAAKGIKRAYMETTMALIKALEAKDGYTATHCYLVAVYAVKLAEELKISQENIEVIRCAAVLHDVGKMSIPDYILKKQEGLTEEEYALIKRHPEQSVQILDGVGLFQQELPIILHHQEWFNGQGYPQGLKGTEIPLGARILAVCDAYEAMTTHRPYRRAISSETAFEKLREGAGTQLDPDLIEPFIKAMRAFLVTTRRIYIPQLNKMVDIA